MNAQVALNDDWLYPSGEQEDSLADSSDKMPVLIRDLQIIDHVYKTEDVFQCRGTTQRICSANDPMDSTRVEFNVSENELLFRHHIKPVLPRVKYRPSGRFRSLHKWEGVVLEVKEDTFLARLMDLSEEGLEEEAEFSLDDVSEEDRNLLQSGAVFYWNIGYHDSYSGQRKKVSEILFRRLPAWTQRELEKAKKEAVRIGNLIGWE